MDYDEATQVGHLTIAGHVGAQLPPELTDRPAGGMFWN
jgi:hypothetical protein